MPTPAPPRTRDERLDEHRRVAPALAATSDARLARLIGSGRPGDVGFCGATVRVDLDGAPLFVKRIPLTDRERRPDAVGSTANLFDMPARCHFGVGSPGFGAWRELAASATTSGWVTSRRSERFPLLHHWRVLPGAPPPGPEFAGADDAAVYWGSDAVRERLVALAGASASLVLVFERLPYTVGEWLDVQVAAGAAEAAAAVLEDELLAGVSFMNAHGMMHFDAHFANVLTDGHRLHLADFGLSTLPGFALSADESALVRHARTHDVGYVLARLVNWLLATFGDPSRTTDPSTRNAYVRACATGADLRGLPPAVARAVRRHAPVAAAVNDYYLELFTVRRDARYPAEAVEQALRAGRGRAGEPP